VGDIRLQLQLNTKKRLSKQTTERRAHHSVKGVVKSCGVMRGKRRLGPGGGATFRGQKKRLAREGSGQWAKIGKKKNRNRSLSVHKINTRKLSVNDKVGVYRQKRVRNKGGRALQGNGTK